MATVSVSAQNTRLDDAESTTDWVGINKTPQLETNFLYQSSNCISYDKGVSGVAGVALSDNVTTDITGTGTYQTVIFKIMTYAPGLMNTLANGGLRVYIGSGANETTDNYVYYLHGSDTYPLTKSWLIVAIDANVAAYRDATNGTPALGSADFYGGAVNNTTSSKIGSIGVDAVDLGGGLTLVGGDGASADGVWQDFIDHDEGTSGNRYGYIFTVEGIIFATGAIIIGNATATEFTDANKTIVFPNNRVDAGFNSLTIGLNSASTTISITDTTFIGAGSGAIIQDFHTTNDVDGTNEEVDIVGHGYKTGDYLDYSKQGGTASMGLTDGNDYWVNAVTEDSISFHTTRISALAGTSKVNLTASGTETHRLTKLTDQRPDFIVSNTSGSATLDGNVYLNHRNITFTSAASQDGGRLECKLLTQGSADISNAVIVTSADPSVACLQDPTFGTTTDLHDVDFVQGALGVLGHALELDTATTYTFTNITFTGYGATASDQAAVDVTAASGTVTINISGGDTPTYKTAGATVNIQNTVTVKVEGVTEGTAIKIIDDDVVGTADNVLFEGLADSNGEITYQHDYTVDVNVIVRANSSGLPSAAIADDNASYIDETTAANSTTTADMTLLPATPVVNQDGYLLGHNEEFGGAKVDVSTAGVGGGTITWQYWNGAWTNLSGVTDNTNSFSVLGENKITWTIPGDWADTTINGQGPFRFVRARFTAGSFSTAPVGRKCALDVTRYLPFQQTRTILSTGLTVFATWIEDTTAVF